MTNFYPRWQKNILAQAMQTRRVLLLSGPRQCGKTTLAKQLTSANTEYRTLDDLALRKLAEIDPQGFIKHDKKTLIIDEVQHVPALFSAIKMTVDEDTRPGQYLLTGSSNIQSLPSVQESLAGRIRKLRLRPLSQGELLQTKPTFLERTFNLNFYKTKKASHTQQVYNRQTILEMCFRGGFPEAITLKGREQKKMASRLYRCAN